MEIQDWDIWQIYSSFLDSEEIDLKTLSIEVVKAGIASCAMHSDGDTWWLSSNEVRYAKTETSISANNNNGQFSFEPEGFDFDELPEYTKEAWYQTAYFQFCERRIFSYTLDSIEYIKVYLGQFHAIFENSEVILYPIVKIYKSGVILVQYRSIAPDRTIELDEFISQHVNLGMHSFEQVEVPPMVAHFAAIAYHHNLKSSTFLKRWKLYRAESLSLLTANTEAVKVQSGDFEAELIPLPQNKDGLESLASLSQTLLSIFGFFANQPRLGISFLLFGQKSITQVGNYWRGRSHVHLLEFTGQKKSSFKILEKYGHELASIHIRNSKMSREKSSEFLPENLRKFDDYIAQISETMSLWVWSKNGIRNQAEHYDPNHGHLVYEQQASIEFLEYGYILQRALLSKIENAESIEEIIKLREVVAKFNAIALDSSKYGELQELFRKGWKAQKLDQLQILIEDQLSIRTQKAQHRESSLNVWKDRALTILFGILAVPTLSEKLLEPVWTLFDFWKPSNTLHSDLFFLAISTTLTITLVLKLLSSAKKGQ